jgi:tetratricopeptide (TPR) repeat protein
MRPRPPELKKQRSSPLVLSAVGGVFVLAVAAIAMLAGPRKQVVPVEPAVTIEPQAQRDPRVGQVAPSAPAPVFAGAEASREGIAAYNAGDMAAAVARFTAAVEHDPNNAEALNNLGQVLVRTGRARDAIPYFDRAIAADGVWSYHFNRARAYGDLKQWRQAIAGYTDAAGLFPDDYVTQFNLARARQADGDSSGALQAYAKAMELAPGQADFHLWYAQALDQSGKRREAAVEYRRFLELDPSASQAEKVKARLTELGDASAASS